MEQHDVFISYQTESENFVISLCEMLEQNDIKCWYAKRDVKECHAREIVHAINCCKVFLIVVDDNVAKEPRGDVLNELNLGCTLYNRGKIKMIRLSVTNNDLESTDLIYYIGRVQSTDMFNRPLNESSSELIFKIFEALGRPLNVTNEVFHKRMSNPFYSVGPKDSELKRLTIQRNLMKKFDADSYDLVFNKLDNCCVLDVGCNTGETIFDRLNNKYSINQVVGIDKSEEVVSYANSLFQGSKFSFHCIDCEADDFLHKLSVVMKDKQIEKFDVVVVSMLILHINNPYRLLKNLREVLKEGAAIIIRDIDDDLNFAFPDLNNNFKRVFSICDNNEDSGYRHSGKEIYSFLVRSGYKNIKLLTKGIDTSEMNYEEKDALFSTYFSFILEDARTMVEKYSSDKKLKDDYLWYKSNYDEIEALFHQPDFIFQLGFMIYIGER